MRGFAARGARSGVVAEENSASRRRHLALDSLARVAHARRPIQITIESFGIAPRLAPAHARGHPASIAVRGHDRGGRPTTSPA